MLNRLAPGHSLGFSHPDPEHGLYDGIRVEVGPDSDVTPAAYQLPGVER